MVSENEKSFSSSTTTISDPSGKDGAIEHESKPERPIFNRWESYPLNETGYHPAHLNLRRYKDRFDADIHRIAGTDTCIQILLLDNTDKANWSTIDIEDTRQLENVLHNHSNLPSFHVGIEHCFTAFRESNYGILTRLIEPQNSYTELDIAREPLLKLLSGTHRSPFILDLLHTYGAKESSENENFPIYEEDSVANEIVYNLKYIHSRPDVTDKEKIVWSIRKMGISAQDRSWIILQASSHFQELLSTVVGSHSSWPEDQCNIHLLAHETCNGNWNPYLNHLERQINELDVKAYCWRPNLPNKAFNDSVSSQGLVYQDSQRIQRIKDSLHQLLYSLSINSDNLASSVQTLSSTAKPTQLQRFERLKCRIRQHRKRTKALIKRADGLMALIPVMLARHEAQTMLTLSRRAGENSRSMRVITIFTMFYLPPSFISSFFGMSLIDWQPLTGKFQVASQIWVVLIASLILLLATFGGWLWWERRCTQSPLIKDEEMGK